MFETIVIYLEPKSYYEYRTRLENENHVWEEGQINFLRKSLGHSSSWSNVAKEEIICDFFRDNRNINFKITDYQSEKGLEWLVRSQFRKDGQLRRAKSVFITEVEADIIKNFSHFEFVGLNFSNYNHYSESYQTIAPIYRTYDKYGNYFDYSATAFNGCELL